MIVVRGSIGIRIIGMKVKSNVCIVRKIIRFCMVISYGMVWGERVRVGRERFDEREVGG